MQRDHTGIRVGWAFVVFGAICTSASCYMFTEDLAYARRSLRAEGRVTSVSVRDVDRVVPTVRFVTATGQNVDVTRLKVQGGAPYAIGDRVDVRYDPAEPAEAQIDSFVQRWLMPCAFAGFGLLFGLLGWSFVRSRRRRDRDRIWLLKYGERTDGIVTGVVRRTYSTDDHSPYALEYRWTDARTGLGRTGQSDDLGFDPIATGRARVGQVVRVYFDPNAPARSCVDLDELNLQEGRI